MQLEKTCKHTVMQYPCPHFVSPSPPLTCKPKVRLAVSWMFDSVPDDLADKEARLATWVHTVDGHDSINIVCFGTSRRGVHTVSMTMIEKHGTSVVCSCLKMVAHCLPPPSGGGDWDPHHKGMMWAHHRWIWIVDLHIGPNMPVVA